MRDPDSYKLPQLMPGGAKVVVPVRMDLSSQTAIEQSVQELGDDADRIDLLINNAGALSVGLLEEQDTDAIYNMVQVNLSAVMQLTKMLLPQMLERKHGKIVNNASISGYAYLPLTTTYAATKAGVVAFSEALRRELADTGVSVLHLVTPGVQTDMLGETIDQYEGRFDTSNWGSMPAAEWAEKVIEAIEKDESVLGPGGKVALAKLLSRGPGRLLDSVSGRMFSRNP